jgi:cell division protein FtsI (penicillin-binding protein 3)
MAAAFSAVINGGILYKPQIISRIAGDNENRIFKTSSKEIRRVISEETSAKMRELLVSSVENGTGSSAKIDFMKVGGKTGTSKKLVDGKYSGTDYNSSFIGFFPAEEPQIVCMILVNSPRNGKYGGLVAAPLFKNVAERILDAEKRYTPAPDKEQNERENFKLVFTNETELKQVSLNEPDNITEANNKIAISRNKMPDLKGQSLRDAIIVLNNLGIKYKINGAGKVVEQSIRPGEKIIKGGHCTLNCKEKSVTGTVIY